MSSKDLKPKKTRLGKSHPQRVKIITWMIGLLACWQRPSYAAYHYSVNTEVEVAVAPVRRADFVVSVRVRGAIRSAHSSILRAPTVPGLRIVHLAAQGSAVKKGDVVVEFDPAQQQQNVIQQTLQVQSIEGSIDQMKATQAIDNGADTLNKMTSEFGVEKAKLDASKAAVISAIDGEKYRISVGVQEGTLQQVKANVNAHVVGNDADIFRMVQRRDKASRDLETANGYLGMMQLRAPTDGVVNVLGNFPLAGKFRPRTRRRSRKATRCGMPPEIVEIPDLRELYIDLKLLEEVDRGKLQIGQPVRIRVDAIPDKGVHRQTRLHQPHRGTGVPGRRDGRKTLSRPCHPGKARPAPDAGDERQRGGDCPQGSQSASHPGALQFRPRRKARCLCAAGQGPCQNRLRWKWSKPEDDDDLVVLRGLKEEAISSRWKARPRQRLRKPARSSDTAPEGRWERRP